MQNLLVQKFLTRERRPVLLPQTRTTPAMLIRLNEGVHFYVVFPTIPIISISEETLSTFQVTKKSYFLNFMSTIGGKAFITLT